MCILNKIFCSYVLGAQGELHVKLEPEDLDLILRARRFCWFGRMELGHIEHTKGAVKTACDAQIDGRRGRL